jgi:excisionase family DNA binding protein
MATATQPKPKPTTAEAYKMLGEVLAQMAIFANLMGEGLEEERALAGADGDPGLTPKQAASVLGVGASTVRLKVRTGEIKAEWHNDHHYTIRRSELEAYRKRSVRTR